MSHCLVLRRVVLYYQLLLACLGMGTVILAASVILSNETTGVRPPAVVLLAGLILGVLVTVSCAIGAVGSRPGPAQPMERHGARVHGSDGGPKSLFKLGALTLYLVLMGGLLSVLLIGGVRLDDFLDNEERVHQYLDGVWDGMRDQAAARLQQYGQCCGFSDYGDRAMEPCTVYEPQVGCREVMVDLFRPRTTNAVTMAFVLAVCLVIGILLDGILLGALVLRLILGSRTPSAKGGAPDDLPDDGTALGASFKFEGNRQPFDAWHKAVFQS